MPYLHFTRSPGTTLAQYDDVVSAMGTDPVAGRTAHWAGAHEGALCTFDVWESRADADRFAAERLFPAFAAVGLHPRPDTQIVAFESHEVTRG